MEEPVEFLCKDKRLYGILHIPDYVVDPSRIVIIITGGPQVRTGSHRLFVQLSRFLCQNKWSSLRFDYEGMGDSEGDFVGYQFAEPSITAAIQFLQKKFKIKLKLIIFSLCDGATATALYAAKHQENISGMILCNPFVLTDEGLARTTIKYYYSRRIISKEFFQKLIHFDLNIIISFKSLWKSLRNANYFSIKKTNLTDANKLSLPEKFISSLHAFQKPIRIILSTEDIVANHLKEELKKNKVLKMDYKQNKIINYVIRGADHTFIDLKVKEELFQVTLKALNEIDSKL